MTGRRPLLSEQQMLELAQWAAFGTSQVDVARRLGVRPAVISRYLNGHCKRFNKVFPCKSSVRS